jgi:hypothetical protein
MSIWDQRVRSHVIWDTQKNLGKLIDQALEREVTDIEITAGIERMRAVLALLGSRLAATDPVLVESITLDTVNTHLVAACGMLEAYSSDGNPAHISSANAKADVVLPYLGSFLAPGSTNDLTAISEAAAHYRQSIESHIASAQEKQNALTTAITDSQNKLATLETGLTSEVQRLAGVVSDQQTQFSTAQDKRNTDFSTALTEQQTKFSTDQDERKTAFADASRANQEKINTLISDFDQKLKDQNSAFNEQFAAEAQSHRTEMSVLKATYEQTAAEILVQVQKHKTDVEKLVGVIGTLGVTSGYVRVANNARTMQFIWQFFTLLAMSGLIFVASLVAFPRIASNIFDIPAQTIHLDMAVEKTNADKPAKFDVTAVAKAPAVGASTAADMPSNDSVFYQGILTRLFLSITFGVFAAYSARQASLYRESEQRNRRRALELESLGPFIEPLDKEMKDKFRIQIGERSFAVSETEPRSTKDDDASTILSLLKNKDFFEIMANFFKTNKP